MRAQYITLAAWAAKFFAKAPPMYTLHKLARSGAIQPAPFVAGRTYYVLPEAELTDPAPVATAPAENEPEERTALYRHFDAEGRLLYVGVSLTAVARQVAHARDAAWFPDVATIKIEHFPTRAAAFAAEKNAIRKEAPIHNIMCRPTTWTLAEPQTILDEIEA